MRPASGHRTLYLQPNLRCCGAQSIRKLWDLALVGKVGLKDLDDVIASGAGSSLSILQPFQEQYPDEYNAFLQVLPTITESVLLLPWQLDPNLPDTPYDLSRPGGLTVADALKLGGFEDTMGQRMRVPQIPDSKGLSVPFTVPRDMSRPVEITMDTPLHDTQVLVLRPLTVYSLLGALVLGRSAEGLRATPSFTLRNFWPADEGDENYYAKKARRRAGGQMAKWRSFCHYLVSASQSLRDTSRKPLKIAFKRLTRPFTIEALAQSIAILQSPTFYRQKSAAKGHPTKNQNIQSSYVIDFAHYTSGGHFLKSGAAQEECLFLQYPETVVSMLLTVGMKDEDAIIIEGLHASVEYDGYMDTLRVIKLLEVLNGPPKNMIVIDATAFKSNEAKLVKQYEAEMVLRETNKVLSAVAGECCDKSLVYSTGNWGCGVFQGEPVLKFLIQWVATSEVGMSMAYFPFNDKLADDLEGLTKRLGNLTVGQLWDRMMKVAVAPLGHRSYLSTFLAQ